MRINRHNTDFFLNTLGAVLSVSDVEAGSALLQEDGNYILLENGGKILLEV